MRLAKPWASKTHPPDRETISPNSLSPHPCLPRRPSLHQHGAGGPDCRSSGSGSLKVGRRPGAGQDWALGKINRHCSRGAHMLVSHLIMRPPMQPGRSVRRGAPWSGVRSSPFLKAQIPREQAATRVLVEWCPANTDEQLFECQEHIPLTV